MYRDCKSNDDLSCSKALNASFFARIASLTSWFHQGVLFSLSSATLSRFRPQLSAVDKMIADLNSSHSFSISSDTLGSCLNLDDILDLIYLTVTILKLFSKIKTKNKQRRTKNRKINKKLATNPIPTDREQKNCMQKGKFKTCVESKASMDYASLKMNMFCNSIRDSSLKSIGKAQHLSCLEVMKCTIISPFIHGLYIVT